MRNEPLYTPPQDLEAFLTNGPCPIYVSFGSIVLQDAATATQLITESYRQAGVRVIISRGWSKLGGNAPNSDSTYYLDDCPHGM